MHTVSPVSTAADRDAAYSVRTEVFVHEQNVPIELELDEFDATAEHFLARDRDDRPVGAGRLLVREDVGILGRLAVLPSQRGTGLGARLVEAIEERARALGLGSIELHSQTHARGFYERLGYEAYGDEELDAGIPHVWMRKKLG